MSEFSVDDLFRDNESLQDLVKKAAVGKTAAPEYKDTLADFSVPRTPMNPRAEASSAGERFRGIKGSLPIPEGKYNPDTDTAHGNTSLSSDLSHFSKLHDAIADIEKHASIHEARIRVQSEGDSAREARGQATLNDVWTHLGNASRSVDLAMQQHIAGNAGSTDSTIGSVGHITDVHAHIKAAHAALMTATQHLGRNNGAYTNASSSAVSDAKEIRNNYITRHADAINAAGLQKQNFKGNTDYADGIPKGTKAPALRLPLRNQKQMADSRAAIAAERASRAPGFSEAKTDIAPQPAVRPAPKVQDVPAFNARVARYTEANQQLATERQETTRAAMAAREASRGTWRQSGIEAGPATGMKDTSSTTGARNVEAETGRSNAFKAQQESARQASASRDAGVAALEELRTRRSAEIESKQANEIRGIAMGGDHLRAATLHWMNTTGRQGKTFAAVGKPFSKTGADKYDKEVRRNPTAYLQKNNIIPGDAKRQDPEPSRTGTFRSTPKIAKASKASAVIEKLATSTGSGSYRTGASAFEAPNDANRAAAATRLDTFRAETEAKR